MEVAVPNPVREHPSRRALVYVAVAAHGPITAAEVRDRTGVPRSTVYEALRDLQGAGLIVPKPDYRDGRRRLYDTVEDPAAGGA